MNLQLWIFILFILNHKILNTFHALVQEILQAMKSVYKKGKISFLDQRIFIAEKHETKFCKIQLRNQLILQLHSLNSLRLDLLRLTLHSHSCINKIE